MSLEGTQALLSRVGFSSNSPLKNLVKKLYFTKKFKYIGQRSSTAYQQPQCFLSVQTLYAMEPSPTVLDCLAILGATDAAMFGGCLDVTEARAALTKSTLRGATTRRRAARMKALRCT